MFNDYPRIYRLFISEMECYDYDGWKYELKIYFYLRKRKDPDLAVFSLGEKKSFLFFWH